MKIKVYNLQAKELTPQELDPKGLGSDNSPLLAQALRIYQANFHQKTSKVLTRGEVAGSTRKIYRQKGTGNARHGAKYAPIFVGGGIAHGPKGIRPANLVLPKKMRRRALSVALLNKLKDSELSLMKGVKEAPTKTSQAAHFLSVVGHPKRDVLLVTLAPAPSLFGAVRNLQGVTMKRASLVNAYDLLAHDQVIMTLPALTSILTRIKGPTSK